MADNKYCTYCNTQTNQKLVFKASKFTPIEVAFKKEKDDLAKTLFTIGVVIEQVFQCLGCERLHIFYTERQLKDDKNFKDNEYQLPKKVERNLPKWLVNINIDFFDLVSEIYSNFNNSHYISFSIASRTLLDVILTETLGDIGGFDKKLNKFLSEGHVTKNQYNVLSFLVNCGNASVHRAYKPTKEVATNILDIIEQLLKEKVLIKQAQAQDPSIPSRNKS